MAFFLPQSTSGNCTHCQYTPVQFQMYLFEFWTTWEKIVLTLLSPETGLITAN